MPDGWWLPQAASGYARAHDAHFMRTMAAAVIIFTIAQSALVLLMWRYRSRQNTKPGFAQPHSRIEILATAATAVVFLGLLGLGARTWAGLQFTPAPRNSEPVEVLARQFAWSFRYPGPDGRFGRTELRLVNDAAGNPFGLDDADPAARDDIVSAALRIPVGRPVLLTLRSLDVIHSLFVRELRIKQDLVPGMRIPLHFQADVAGTYEIPCAELCGLGHHQMRTTLVVMPAPEFDEWKRGQAR